MFSQLLSGIKVKLVDKMVQSNLFIYVLFYTLRAKNCYFSLFLPDFEFLKK